MPSDEPGLVERLRRWLGRSEELPCGCVIRDNHDPRFSDRVTEADSEPVEFDVRRYRNCTKKKVDRRVTLRCDQCGAEWVQRFNGTTSIDFGAENPDADMRLETKHLVNRYRPTRYVEEPIVESPGGERR